MTQMPSKPVHINYVRQENASHPIEVVLCSECSEEIIDYLGEQVSVGNASQDPCEHCGHTYEVELVDASS